MQAKIAKSKERAKVKSLQRRLLERSFLALYAQTLSEARLERSEFGARREECGFWHHPELFDSLLPLQHHTDIVFLGRCFRYLPFQFADRGCCFRCSMVVELSRMCCGGLGQ